MYKPCELVDNPETAISIWCMGNVSQLKPQVHAARDEVAAAVRAFIARAGVSKSAVARATGFTQSTFSRRTNGQEPFDIDELGALADYFDVELADLISGDVTKIPPNAKKAPRPDEGERLLVGPPGGIEPPPIHYKGQTRHATIIRFPVWHRELASA